MPNIVTSAAPLNPVGAKLFAKSAAGVGGWVAPYFSVKKIAALGDSLVGYCYYNGFTLVGLSANFGGYYQPVSAESECPSDAGILTLSSNTLTWTPNGSTAGNAVDATKDGLLYVPGPSELQGIWISWLPSSNTYTDGTSSITIPANGQQQSGWYTKGFMTWFNALSLQRYEWSIAPGFSENGQKREAVHGMFGATTASLLAAYWQWGQTSCDEWHIMIGRNDITASIAYSTIIANLDAIYSKALIHGKKLRLYSITPRNSDTSTQRKIRSAVNRWIGEYCRNTPGCTYVPAAESITDTSNGNLISICDSGDGLHPSATGAYFIGTASVIAGDDNNHSAPYLTDYDDIYNASSNPNGNLIPTTGYAVWNGSSGTQNAGTSGTLASGRLSQIYSGTVSGVNSQVARTDGIQGNLQQTAVTITASGQQSIKLSSNITSGFSVGSPYELLQEMWIVSSSSGITLADTKISLIGVSARACSGLLGGIPAISSPIKMVLRSPIFYIPPSVTAINPEILISGGNGSSVTLQFGRQSIRKVIFP